MVGTLTILEKFCNVKKWVGRPKKETVKTPVTRDRIIFVFVDSLSCRKRLNTYFEISRKYNFIKYFEKNLLTKCKVWSYKH